MPIYILDDEGPGTLISSQVTGFDLLTDNDRSKIQQSMVECWRISGRPVYSIHKYYAPGAGGSKPGAI